MVASYFLISLSILRKGTIIFGQESIVLTLRNSEDIEELDYDKSNKNWYWLGNDRKISELYSRNKKFKKAIDEKDCVEVSVRFVNLFIPSNSAYVSKSNIPIVYLYSLEFEKECK